METPKELQGLIEAMTAYMTECMAGHDPSHNPAHVHRVVSLAHRVLAGELARHPDTAPSMYDTAVVTLAATLHDIGDHKYLPAADRAAAGASTSIDPKQMVYDALIRHGADATLAKRVQTIVTNVSYTNETKNPEKVRALIAQPGYHELAIVQDADRLDAIGAVGIARTFTYLGSQGSKRKSSSTAWELDESIAHFGEKLEKLESMMKTETGREMARERTRRLQEFKAWWIEETTPFTL
ncbi:hypothetical protein UA08_05093 [Talaromyces atroroseus]|uniref:HD/PDEase domain-containing protein n=1 Tax=Talaromyces atroroseus TaxID=1441469 RepID=A0A225AEC3_TALAT|nr:hypothetical protein UA08_05093 [Talaromyces atroroseus]OKL59601.1 hypothetical protein UA08_05093 [Talaromyces atroroseus]